MIHMFGLYMYRCMINLFAKKLYHFQMIDLPEEEEVTRGCWLEPS